MEWEQLQQACSSMQNKPCYDDCPYHSLQKDRLNILSMVLPLLTMPNLHLLICTAEEKTSVHLNTSLFTFLSIPYQVYPKQEEVHTNWPEIQSLSRSWSQRQTWPLCNKKQCLCTVNPFLLLVSYTSPALAALTQQRLFSRLTCENLDTNLNPTQFSGCRVKPTQTNAQTCLCSNKFLFTNIDVCKCAFSL